MAFETVSIKDAAGNTKPVVVDQIGSDFVQVQKMGYGADGAIVGLDEKPAVASKQDAANAALGAPADAEAGGSDDGSIVALLKNLRTRLASIDAELAGTLGVAGTVNVGNFPVGFQVIGAVEITNDSGNAIPVNGPLTDAQLRAASVPVSAAALPLPAGAATETTLAALNAKTPAVGQAAMAASTPVVLASDQSAVPVNQAGVSAVGAITALNANLATGVATANSAVALSLAGATGFSVDLRGTFVGTIIVQGSVNGTDWITLSVLPIGAGLNIAQVASATAPGAWWGNANGLHQVRATASAYTSGTINVTLRAMQGAGVVFNMPAGQTAQPVSLATNTPTLAAGTNLAADVGIQYRANATGAGTPTNYVSPATPAGATIKGGAGRHLGYFLVNLSAGVRWVKVFNATAVTMGTTSAAYEFPIPAGGVAQLQLPGGIAHATGIMVAVTTARGLTDNTAGGALGDVVGFFLSA